MNLCTDPFKFLLGISIYRAINKLNKSDIKIDIVYCCYDIRTIFLGPVNRFSMIVCVCETL